MIKFFKNPVNSILLISCITFLVLLIYYVKNPLTPKLSIEGNVFTYELAITPQEHEHGLSGRDPLPQNHGMLFVFDHKEQVSFWMKEMKFSLDMIWIDDNKIVDISKNVPAPIEGQRLPIYSPKKPVNRVFKVNAGTADKLGLKEGDTVTYLRK